MTAPGRVDSLPMRLVLVALATLVLALVLGYEPTIGRTFRTTFPEVESGIRIAALPVTIHDLTGRVTRMELAAPLAQAITAEGRFEPVEGQPNAIRVEWLGGACESHVRAVLHSEGELVTLAMQSSRSLGGMLGCVAAGVARSLIVHFDEPIPTRQFRFYGPVG